MYIRIHVSLSCALSLLVVVQNYCFEVAQSTTHSTHCSCSTMCVHNEEGTDEGGTDLLGQHEVHLGSTYHRQAGAEQSTNTPENSTDRLEGVWTVAQI